MWIVNKTCQCRMPGIIPAMPGIIPGIPGIIPAIPGIIAMVFVALWQLQWHLGGTNDRNPRRVFVPRLVRSFLRARTTKTVIGCGKKLKSSIFDLTIWPWNPAHNFIHRLITRSITCWGASQVEKVDENWPIISLYFSTARNPGHKLGCRRLYWKWDITVKQLVQDFFHQQYLLENHTLILPPGQFHTPQFCSVSNEDPPAGQYTVPRLLISKQVNDLNCYTWYYRVRKGGCPRGRG